MVVGTVVLSDDGEQFHVDPGGSAGSFDGRLRHRCLARRAHDAGPRAVRDDPGTDRAVDGRAGRGRRRGRRGPRVAQRDGRHPGGVSRVPRRRRSTITASGSGGTSTPASSRRGSMPACPGSTARRTACVQSPVPWATPGSKFTLLFERLAIDWLREAAVTRPSPGSSQLGWDAVWGIERRAVARGLARRGTLALRYVGVDEKSFQRRHDYVTVVSDLERARVLYVADDRKQESLEAFWALGLTAAQRTASRRSRWTCGRRTSRRRAPGSRTPTDKIVFDRFHCAKHLNEGVDRVRRAEQRELRRGDDVG